MSGELTPRAALEALGFRFEAVPRSRGVSVEMYAPSLPNGGAVSWRVRATWPDSPEAVEYVETLLREAEARASSARALADTAARDATAAEEHAARVRAVAEGVRR